MSAFSRFSALKRTLELRARSRALREFSSVPEQMLWAELRASRLGVAFRRQVVVLGFIADFVAPALRLIVEVDGASHEKHRARDASRDRKLARLGYVVLRLDAKLVLRELPKAVERIRTTVAKCRCNKG